ncbi:unnamed protein product, partial [Lymnaea stagnalis]
LVSDDQFAAIEGLYSAVGTIVSIIGLVTNAITIKTFVAMGADDGVTVSFLCLSSAEFVCFLALLGQELSMTLWVIEMISGYRIVFFIQPMAFNNFFGNIRNCLFTIPVLMTVYLSVAKCMCVVKPLHFKNMFSVRQTLWIMAGFCVFAIVSYVPIFASIGVPELYDGNINKTRPMLWISPELDVIKNVVWTMRDSVPCFASEVIIIICIYVMSDSLMRATKFRASSTSGGMSASIRDSHHKYGKHVKGNTSQLGGSELQVIKQVVLISVVYIVGNTPKIVVFLAMSVVPDLRIGQRHQNLVVVIANTRELIEMIMSAVNIFIYYEYNSKFRSLCKY